jgi:hypothetical protein
MDDPPRSEWKNVPLWTANACLDQLLRVLQTSKEPETLVRTRTDMDLILYGAIRDMAALTNAVAIEAIIETERDDTRLLEAHTRFSGRFQLKEYLKLATVRTELEPTMQYQFIKHLPHANRLGEEPGGRRIAYGLAIESVGAEYRGFPKQFPMVLIGLNDGDHQTRALLFPDEVQSIRLVSVPDEAYSPFMNTGHYPPRLETPHSAVEHYLRFRKFRQYPIGESLKAEPEQVARIAQRLRIPAASSSTFKSPEVWEIGKFAFDSNAELAERGILYEFQHPISRSIVSGEEFTLWAAREIAEWPQRNRNFTGRAIIERLAAISVDTEIPF